MEDNLEEIKKIIDNAGVSTIDVEELENMLKEIRYSYLFCKFSLAYFCPLLAIYFSLRNFLLNHNSSMDATRTVRIKICLIFHELCHELSYIAENLMSSSCIIFK